MAKITRERGIDRAIDILDCLHRNRRPMVVNELASATGAPRSTVYSLVKVLLDRSFLDTYSDGRVYLGRKLFLYGTAVPEHYSLIELAQPVVDDLAETCGERVELNSVVDWKQAILCVSSGPRPFFFPLNAGATYPLPLTASGRFLIAGIDEETLRQMIPEEDYFRNGKRVIALEHFLRDSEVAQSKGYSVTSGLLDSYLGSMAAPILTPNDDVIATIGIAFPSSELEANEERFARELVRSAAFLRDKLRADT